MDKRTFLAVVLSVAVITGGFIVQNTLFPPVQGTAPAANGQTVRPERQAAPPVVTDREFTDESDDFVSETDRRPAAGYHYSVHPFGDSPSARDIEVETDKFIITFSTRGAMVTSMLLKEHTEEGRPLEMVQRGQDSQGAFDLRFGGPDASPVLDSFHYRRVDNNTHEFYRDFAVVGIDGNEVPFRLRKIFSFRPQDHLLELRIAVENSVRDYPNLNFDGFSYTVGYGPQIGPMVEKLDGRYEYRHYYTYADGKQVRHRIRNTELQIVERVSWAALLGKYFTVVGIPDATRYTITFSESPSAGLPHTSKLFFSRPPIRSSRNEDVFRFYVGPKANNELSRYNDASRNGFGIQDLNLDEVMDTSTWLGWLEWILKNLLSFFYRIVPNYGIAIILLTIFTKLIMHPVTRKSFESTRKMQSLSPKITGLKEKYKDNPNKMNQEMAELYKKEKVNPLGGCLPMLLQMPIFIALYGLLNKHFELRNAVFIRGWINDLSSPESIFNFAPFTLPLLGWSDIRLLPILFVGTMMLSSKLMQTPATNAGPGGGSMKMMTYMMPVVFFFILYDAPSGLLLYWTITNMLTMFTQKFDWKKILGKITGRG